MPTSPVPFPPQHLLAFHLLFHVALATNPITVRRACFPPLAAILIYLLYNTSTPHRTQNWLTGHMLVIELLTASDYLLVTADVHELRQTGTDSKFSISTAPFVARLKWASRLTLNPRGIGWLHEPTSALPPRPTASRSTFLVCQIVQFAVHAFALLVIGRAASSVPVLRTGSPGLGSNGWLQRLLAVLLLWSSLYTCARVRGCAMRIVFVGLGFWDPYECPELFDSWRQAYSVRKFWGKFWHQIIRRILVSHSKLIAHRILNLHPGSTASAYTQLFVAFFLSGIIHYSGQYMLLRDESRPMPKGPLVFFLAQAVVITLEDGLVAVGKKLHLTSGWWRVIGYAWVVAWLSISTPVWIDQQVAAGFMDIENKGGMTLKFAVLGDLYLDM
ncbi:acetyltransferase sirH [Favolaschia claudopus]|uniref:Acetyltransferase sirH n=1 Tax=Favolaschia claudopus TaxID=2862362 RepID=A0AAW0AJE4_9AGAR